MFSASRPRQRLLLLLSLLFLIGLFKLALVATDEMVAVPYDSVAYANLISYFYFGAPNDWWRPSLLPLVGSAFYALGIPYRLGIEIIYLVSCGIMAGTLFYVTDSLIPAFVGFPLAAFHPYTFTYFRYLLPGPLFCSFLLLFFAIALLVLARKRAPLSLVALLGVIGACLSLIRLESSIVLAFLSAFALLYILQIYVRDRDRPRLLAVAVLLPFLCFYAVITSARAANYFTWGTFNVAGYESGLEKLLTTLYSIKVPDSARRDPVTRTALNIAFELSPSFRMLRPSLIDPDNRDYKIGEIYTHREGDFGPQLNVALFGAAMSASEGSQQKADALLARAADEIATGLSVRHIPTHFVLMYPLDPNYRNWLPQFFNDLPRWLALSIVPPSYDQRPRDGTPLNPSAAAVWRQLTGPEIQVFDLALNRRTALLDSYRSGRPTRALVRHSISVSVLRFIATYYGYILGAGILVYVVSGIRHDVISPMSAPGNLAFALLFMIVCLSLRTIAYTMITAAAFPSQPRYVALEAPSFLFAAILAVGLTIHILDRAFRPSPAAASPAH